MASVQGEGDPLLSNKIAGAVLGTLLFAMGLNIGSQILFTPKKPAIPGYDLPAPEAAPAAGEASDQQAQAEPLPVRLASADPAKGMSAAKKCLACHVLEKGGPNKIGPGLYGVIGHQKGSHAGFSYSAAMKAKGGEWTFDDLDQFLANPKAYVPGTIMAFAGISSPKERADVVRYLQTLSDSPVPLPAAEPAAAAAPAGAPPGPSQTQQRPTPAMPGQAAPQAPAPVPATPVPGNTTQSQPGGSTGAANPERPANPTGAVGQQQPAPGGGTAPPVRQ